MSSWEFFISSGSGSGDFFASSILQKGPVELFSGSYLMRHHGGCRATGAGEISCMVGPGIVVARAQVKLVSPHARGFMEKARF